MNIYKTTFLLVLALISNLVQATTYIDSKPFTINWKTKLLSKTYTTNSVEQYPDFNFTNFDTSNNVVTDILVFYAPDTVKQLGSVEEVYRYINDGLAFANESYKNSHIPITRRIAAILPYPYTLKNKDNIIYENIGQFGEDLKIKGLDYYKNKYGASYFVLYQSYDYVNNPGVVGVSVLGGSTLMVATYQKDGANYTRTLGHELGHSDGLNHVAGGATELEAKSMLTPYAVGASCGDFKSLMSNEVKDINVPFFSSPNIVYKNETPCGTMDVADVTDSYLSNMGLLINHVGNSVFSNNVSPTERVGTVSFTQQNITVSETQGSVDVFFDWVGVPLGASVEVYISYDTATESDAPYFSTRITNDGSSFLTFNVTDNTVISQSKTAHLALRYPVGVNLTKQTTLPVTITSDEPFNMGQVKFESPKLTLNENKSKTVNIVRSGGSDGAFTLNLTVTLDTASQADFKQITQTIEFADKETSKTITITALKDSLVEKNEVFTITLASTADVLSSQNTLTVEIIDKTPPVIPTTLPQKSSGGGSTSVLFYLLLIVAFFNKKVFNYS